MIAISSYRINNPVTVSSLAELLEEPLGNQPFHITLSHKKLAVFSKIDSPMNSSRSANLIPSSLEDREAHTHIPFESPLHPSIP